MSLHPKEVDASEGSDISNEFYSLATNFESLINQLDTEKDPQRTMEIIENAQKSIVDMLNLLGIEV